jgi:hypothetical protein
VVLALLIAFLAVRHGAVEALLFDVLQASVIVRELAVEVVDAKCFEISFDFALGIGELCHLFVTGNYPFWTSIFLA